MHTPTSYALVSSLAVLLAAFAAPPLPGGEATISFPELADLPPSTVVADELAVTTAPGGHYAVNGKPRFLVGAEILPAYINGARRTTAGTPPELRWLYEKPLDYASARRLGLDTLGYFTSPAWIADYVPGFADRFLFSPDEMAGMGEVLRSARLPVYVDFTCWPWTHGSLLEHAGQAGIAIPPAAMNAGGSQVDHWVPYSATTEEGRGIYQAIWRSGTAEAQKLGLHALVYELFNEPAYDDHSEPNRKLFQARITARFGTIDILNRAWGSAYPDFAAVARFKAANANPGLQAEWGSFMEEAFTGLCRLGRETVQAVDHGAPCAVQPAGMDYYRAVGKSNVNVYQLAGIMDVVGTGTGGGIMVSDGQAAPVQPVIDTPDFDVRVVEGFLHLRFLRAVAGGKPIYDGESYSVSDLKTPAQLADNLWLELARGCNATYMFGLERRSWDPLWKDLDEAGGRRLAEKFRFDMLNPYATDPAVLTGFQDFKRDKVAVEGLLVPRRNRVPGVVGLLLSLPSERIAPAVACSTHQQIRTYANALEFSQQAYDVVLEERLAAEARHLTAIVVPGVRYAYAETPARLRAYVEAGGVLILGMEAMEADQYGQPRPGTDLLGPPLGIELPPTIATLNGALAPPDWLPGALRGQPWRAITATTGWTTLASAGTAPAVLERRLGAGRIYYLGLRMPAYPLASLLGSLLANHGVQRLCDLRTDHSPLLTPNVEVHRFHADGIEAHYLFNWDRYPKLVTLAMPGGTAVDLLRHRLAPIESGHALLILPAMASTVVISGQQAALEQGGYLTGCAVVTRNALANEFAAWHPAASAGQKAGLGPDFPVTQARFQMLDLRQHANRGFVDQLPGDGTGGWTDQGSGNSLDGTPWGRQELLGVPFEFIRTDENNDRTCLVMRSTNLPSAAPLIAGIPVGRQIAALDVLHTAAWCGSGLVPDGVEVMRYVVRYADGGTAEIPIRNQIEIADWWQTKPLIGQARRAWFNTENRSLFAWRWENPHPDRLVTSVDVVSPNGPAVGILVAATVELAADGTRIDLPIAAWKAGSWLGAQVNVASVAGDQQLTVAPGPGAKDWCGGSLKAGTPDDEVAAPGGGWPVAGTLTFQINGAADAWGSPQGSQELQVSLLFRHADGPVKAGPYVKVDFRIDNDPATWQPVTMPLHLLAANAETAAIAGLSVQFSNAPLAGVLIRRPAVTMPSGD